MVDSNGSTIFKALSHLIEIALTFLVLGVGSSYFEGLLALHSTLAVLFFFGLTLLQLNHLNVIFFAIIRFCSILNMMKYRFGSSLWQHRACEQCRTQPTEHGKHRLRPALFSVAL